MNEQIPFSTDDAIQAFCLYIAGVPEFRPPTNTFDEPKLKKLGYAGLPLLEAAQSAWKHNERGQVQYWFERTPELVPLLEAYTDQQAKITEEGNDIDGGEHLRGIMARATNGPQIMDEREALLRVACVVLKGRTQFVNRWKEAVPYLRIMASGQPQDLGNSTTLYPGFKLFPVNLPEDKISKLGL